MAARDVVVVSGVRTAIGEYGGSLKDTPPTKLGAIAIREAVARAKIDPASVGHVVLGSVIHGEARDMYISRVAAIEGGIPVGTPALTVNRLSRAAYFLPAGRWGQRMGDGVTIDAMVGALNDPFGHGHMGITAENVAAKYGFTREQQDAFALESHRRAAKALDEGRFTSQVVAVELKSKKGPVQFAIDEHVRKDAKAEDFSKLKTVFKKDGTVTAGNASGINDAGAAVVLMEAGAAAKAGIKPLGRLVAYAHAGVDPDFMGLGPIPAVRRVFEKSGLKPSDMDVIESNEAFAVQAMAVSKDLGLDPAKVNPNGGAVALGHPIGATGCILTIKALYELERIKGKYALVTMCIGGGQGIAAIFERLG